MSKAQLVITAVVLEGRSKSEVAPNNDVCQLCGKTRHCPATERPVQRMFIL